MDIDFIQLCLIYVDGFINLRVSYGGLFHKFDFLIEVVDDLINLWFPCRVGLIS